MDNKLSQEEASTKSARRMQAVWVPSLQAVYTQVRPIWCYLSVFWNKPDIICHFFGKLNILSWTKPLDMISLNSSDVTVSECLFLLLNSFFFEENNDCQSWTNHLRYLVTFLTTWSAMEQYFDYRVDVVIVFHALLAQARWCTCRCMCRQVTWYTSLPVVSHYSSHWWWWGNS